MKKKLTFLYLIPLLVGCGQGNRGSSISSTPVSSFDGGEDISFPKENARRLDLDRSSDKASLIYDASEVHFLSLPRVTSKGWYLGYQNMGRYDDGFVALKTGGCLYNPHTSYGTHNAFPGLKNIVIDYDALPGTFIYLAYGWSESYYQNSICLESGVSFDFLDLDPGYFKIYSLSSKPIYINSVTIRFMGQEGAEPAKKPQ